jgi:hypothetical protein
MPSTVNTFVISIFCVLAGRWVRKGHLEVVNVSAPADAASGDSEFNCSCNCPVLAPARTVVVTERLEPSWAACSRWLWIGSALQWVCCRVWCLVRALFTAGGPVGVVIQEVVKPTVGPRTPSQLRIQHG